MILVSGALSERRRGLKLVTEVVANPRTPVAFRRTEVGRKRACCCIKCIWYARFRCINVCDRINGEVKDNVFILKLSPAGSMATGLCAYEFLLGLGVNVLIRSQSIYPRLPSHEAGRTAAGDSPVVSGLGIGSKPKNLRVRVSDRLLFFYVFVEERPNMFSLVRNKTSDHALPCGSEFPS